MNNEAPPAKTILLIDMDAFFASVEQRDNPSLRDKPIAVIGSNRRFVLVSPSYEARAFGVKTGMRGPEAKSLCPDIILVKADTERIFQRLGISTSEAINLFLAQVKMRKGLPFDVRIPSKATLKAMKDADEGKNLTIYDSVDDFFKKMGV